MKANELRIGNYVNLTDETIKEYYKVTEIELNKLQSVEGIFDDYLILSNVDDFYIDDIQPIPLTEEWLLKFGFEISMVSETHNYSFKIDGFKIDNLLKCGCFYYKDLEIKYVHKLQNLYFALTNKELTICQKDLKQ